ncbi:MAG: hypothetical protein H5T97_02895 [Firmicutes bacterium]|nr:hypothetical protein [Bacillota bacterium]
MSDPVAEVSASLEAYLPVLRDALARAAVDLSLGEDQGLAVLAAALDGLEWVAHIMNRPAVFVRSRGGAEEWQGLAQRYLEGLRLLLRAWEHGDHVALGEVLRHEVVPVLDDFGALFAAEVGRPWAEARL